MSDPFFTVDLNMELCKSFCKPGWKACVCFCSRSCLSSSIGTLSSCLGLFSRAFSIIGSGFRVGRDLLHL